MMVWQGASASPLARVRPQAVRTRHTLRGIEYAMNFNVAQLLKEVVGAVCDYEVDDTLASAGEPWETCEITGHVHFLRTHRGVLVTGDLTTTVPATCGYCLEPAELPLALALEDEFFPSFDVNTGLPSKAPDDEPDPFLIDNHHILDLTEAVRQAIVLSTPISPRCREDCEGLCPVCGANRNIQACRCSMATDARWASLNEMLQELGREERA
ncbi:MAG: DUF177 domain-containing protein [Chloroflexi bacterium]|nr:DUF177 domain-containing protein [Chloroflexota bacterium]